jgi:hypothetical protein
MMGGQLPVAGPGVPRMVTPFLPFKIFANHIAGEWAEHHEVYYPDFDFSCFAKIICYYLCTGNDTSLTKDQVICIFGLIGHNALIAATGELIVFFEGLLCQFLDVVKEEGPLSSHTLHVGILVLDDTRHHRIVHIPEFGNTTAGVTVDNSLGRCRRFDDVIRTTEKFFDQLSFR